MNNTEETLKKETRDNMKSLNKSRSNRLLINTAIFGIGTMLSKGIAFVMIPLFSRWLSLDDYGTFELLWTYITLLIPIITLTIGEACFRFLLETEREEKKKYIFSSGIIIPIVGLAIASVIIVVIFKNELKYYFVLLLWTQTFYEYFNYALRGIKNNIAYTLSNILYMLAMVIFSTVSILVFQMGIKGLFIGYISGNIIASIISICYLRKLISLKSISKNLLIKMTKYSIPLIANNVSWWIAGVADRSLVTLYIGAGANAIYSVANKIPSICTLLYSVFQLSWVQNASEEVESSDYDIYVRKVNERVIVFLLSTSLCILAINPILFEYIFDNRYEFAQTQVPILLMAVIFSTVSSFLGGIFIAHKDTRMNGSTTIIGALTNIILDWIFIRYFGLWAATIATLISYVVIFVIRWRLLNLKFGIKLSISFNTVKLIIIFLILNILQYIDININYYWAILGLSVVIALYYNKDILLRCLSIVKR